MDGDAVALRVVDELVEIGIEMLDHIRADGVGALTALAPVGQRLEGVEARADTAAGIAVQGFLKRFIRERDANLLTELVTIH